MAKQGVSFYFTPSNKLKNSQPKTKQWKFCSVVRRPEFIKKIVPFWKNPGQKF
jgi:hypothetical protein